MADDDKTPEKTSPPKKEVVLRVGFQAPTKPKLEQYNPLDGMSGKVGDSAYDRVDAKIDAPAVIPGRSPLQKSSTQIPEDTFAYHSHLNAVQPPYNMEYLTLLNEISVTRQACIAALTTNTVGLGFQIVKLQAAIDEDVLKTVAGRVKRQLNKWAMADGKSFTQLLFAVKYDEETTGNGFIEVDRDRTGRIKGLYHVPAYTMRRKRDKSGWLQERPGAISNLYSSTRQIAPGYVEFYNFGDKYDPDTGALRPNREPFVNEIIHIPVYNARTTFYGMPRDIAALATYAGDEMARNQNVKYLTNAAVPEIALIFEVDAAAMERMFGDQPVRIEVPESVRSQMEEHFRYNLSAPHYHPGIFHLPMGVRLRIERLSQPNRDAAWSSYRTSNKMETLRAWRTPAVVIGDAEAAQYATAAVQKHIYLEQVIEPEQRKYAELLMNFLWPEITNIPEAAAGPDGNGVDPEWFALRFVKMSVADKAVDATVHNIYLTQGVLDANEVREEIGYAQKPKKPESALPPLNPVGTADNAAGTMPNGGRGPNGTMAPPTGARRPGDVAIPAPANIMTMGRPGYDLPPVAKSASVQDIRKAADGDDALITEYVDRVEDLFRQQVEEWARDAQLAASERVLDEEG